VKDSYYITDGKGQIVCTAWLTPDVTDWPPPTFLLNRIQVTRHQGRKGYGSKLLQIVCELADEEGVVLILGVSPDDSDDFDWLVKWYEKFGFTAKHKDRELNLWFNLMERLPIQGVKDSG